MAATGIISLNNTTPEFEKAYLNIRSKEHRLYSDELVRLLPNLKEGNHKNEWKLRRKTATRFCQYLEKKSELKHILEIGCGNGWFSNLICKNTVAQVHGSDINKIELEQAAGIFSDDRLTFLYGDILKVPNWEFAYDLIIFNGSIQYFQDLSFTLNQTKNLLASNGEIHILDSNFYPKKTVNEAKQRSKLYYEQNETQSMIPFYHHHTVEELNEFNPIYLYKPGLKTKILGDSPFPWIKISWSNE